VSRLLQRAALVGLGGYAVAVVLAGWFAVRYPEAYVHFTPLQGFGLDAAAKVASFAEIALGAAVGLLFVRAHSLKLSTAWLLSCGAVVVLVDRVLPALPPIVLESCPPGELCNPFDWSVPLESFREPLLALAAVMVVGMIASGKAGSPPETPLERTRGS
jgi:hypothetical protein